MKKTVLWVLTLLSLVGCHTYKDPFLGESFTGARMNLNGDKLLLYSGFRPSYQNNQEAYFNFEGTFINSVRGENEPYVLYLGIEPTGPIEVGKTYDVQLGDAVISLDHGETRINLRGTITFNKFTSQVVEAEFELNADGYSIKHGLVRIVKEN